MLPSGATVSGKAAKELKESGRPVVAPSPESSASEAGLPLNQGEPQIPAVPDETPANQPAADVLLRPLGHGASLEPLGATPTVSAPPPPPTETPEAPAAPQQTGPSHGLADSATQTSIDISQYVGSDQSIFRPIKKDEGFASAASMDRVTTKRRVQEKGPGSDWSENDRLKRCAIAGLAVGVTVSVLQYLITKSVPSTVFTAVPIGSGIMGVIKLGIVMGVALGFGLGAMLVKFQKGSGIGFLLGMLLGYAGYGGASLFMLGGAVAGILDGRFATLGIRRVINV